MKSYSDLPASETINASYPLSAIMMETLTIMSVTLGAANKIPERDVEALGVWVKARRSFSSMNKFVQFMASLVAIATVCVPAGFFAVDGPWKDGSTRIVSPADGGSVDDKVNVKVFLSDDELRDRVNDVAISLCYGVKCYLADALTSTGKNEVSKEMPLGGSGDYVIRIDRIPNARLASLLKEKQAAIGPDKSRSWSGFSPEKLGEQPLDVIKVQRP